MTRNKPSKIDRLGLGPKIQRLLSGGVTSASDIHSILEKEDGATWDSATTARYVRRLKDTARLTSAQILQDHVERVVPKDLDALEEMEAQCLAWFRERPIDQIERLAAAAVQIKGEMESWADMLRAAYDPEERDATLKRIISTALRYVLMDARLQEKRVQAMKTAVQIIDLKLSRAGLLDDTTKGRILLVSSDSDKSGTTSGSDEASSGQRRLRLVMRSDAAVNGGGQ